MSDAQIPESTLRLVENQADNGASGRDYQADIYRALVENSLDAILLTAPDGTILYANPAACALFQMTAAEIIRGGRGIIVDTEDPRLRPALEERNRPGRFAGELNCKKADGTLFPAYVSSVIFRDDAGFLRSSMIIRDISEKNRAEMDLKKSRERLRSILRTTPVGIGVVQDRKFMEVNRYLCDMTGYGEAELIGLSSRILYYSQPEFERVGKENCQYISEEGIGATETRWRAKDGKTMDILLSSTLLNPQDPSEGVAFAALDITKRKQAEIALRKSEEKFRYVFDRSVIPKSIILISGDLYPNEALCHMLGYSAEELARMKWMDITHPEDVSASLARMEALIRGEKDADRFLKRCLRKDGGVVWSEISTSLRRDDDGKPMYFMTTMVDITEAKHAESERKKLQQQLIQAQKMESVGRLAGGVAHDFNNMLSVIQGYTELALDRAGDDASLREDLKEVMQAARRSADITRQLLAFARRQSISPRFLDLNETVEGMLKMLRRLIGEDIELAWQPGSGLWRVHMDPSQVDQILANLCANARDAIAGVGKILIKTENRLLSRIEELPDIEFVPGEYVMIVVSDTGCGMDMDTRAQIFEPFFTTKPIGEGTGLGLATVYGIVKQNSGLISVENGPGSGSTFRVYLPRREERAAGLNVPAEDQMPLSRGETVMVVEDELAILGMAARMLHSLGYTVLAAENPSRALKMARLHQDRIDVLITDVVMPEMNGRDLADRLKEIHPESRVLFVSGYTADIIAHLGVLEKGVRFMAKPFTQQDLAKKVRGLLGE